MIRSRVARLQVHANPNILYVGLGKDKRRVPAHQKHLYSEKTQDITTPEAEIGISSAVNLLQAYSFPESSRSLHMISTSCRGMKSIQITMDKVQAPEIPSMDIEEGYRDIARQCNITHQSRIVYLTEDTKLKEKLKRFPQVSVGGAELFDLLSESVFWQKSLAVLLNPSETKQYANWSLVLCSPAMLPKLQQKCGRVLGPLGVLPSLKKQTVGDDYEDMIRRGINTVTITPNEHGQVRIDLGDMNWCKIHLEANIQAAKNALGEALVEQENLEKTLKAYKSTMRPNRSPRVWLQASDKPLILLE